MGNESTQNPLAYDPNADKNVGLIFDTFKNDEGKFESVGESTETFKATIPNQIHNYFLETTKEFAQALGVEVSFSEDKKIFNTAFTIKVSGDPSAVQSFSDMILKLGGK